jgi:hypothetical protein
LSHSARARSSTGRSSSSPESLSGSILLVNRQLLSTSAVLRRVSTTRHGTLLGPKSGLVDRVTAVALLGVFETSVGVTLADTVVDTLWNGHILLYVTNRESTSSKVVVGTSYILPSLGGNVGGVGGLGSDDSGGTAVDSLNCVSGAGLDGVAARETVQPAGGLLLHGRRNDAVVNLLVGKEIEDLALLDDSGLGIAFVDGTLKSGGVPAVDEVCMERVTGRVTVGENEGVLIAVPFTIPRRNIEEELVEEGDETLGVSGWALSVVHQGRIGNVGLVVRGVEVDTVPAGGHDHLGTETTMFCQPWLT